MAKSFRAIHYGLLLGFAMITNSRGNNSTSTCQLVKESNTKKVKVHLGWPLYLSCLEISNSFFDSVDYGFDEQQAECSVREVLSCADVWNETFTFSIFSNAGLQNAVYVIENVTEKTPESYLIKMKTSTSCFYQMLLLEKITLKSIECTEAPRDIERLTHEQIYGQETIMYCLPTNGESYSFEPKIYLRDQQLSDVEYNWTHNCSKQLGPGVKVDGNKLSIPRTQFENGGSYECAINYKGMKRYVMTKKLCVQYKAIPSEVFNVVCPSKIYGTLGNNITINCSAAIGTGKQDWFSMTSTWRKIETGELQICENSVAGQTSESQQNARMECLIQSNLVKECYQYKPNKPDPLEKVSITLTIRNLNYSDFGSYTVKFGLSQYFSIGNVSVVQDDIEENKLRIAAVSASITLSILAILLLIICFSKRHDVLWFWKRHCGRYETETHAYVAYLAYYYKHPNMTQRAKEQTFNLVTSIQSFLDSRGWSMYDKNQAFSSNQYEAQSICEAQKHCHRVIIMLTPDYIESEWSIHETYRALQYVLENGNKVIFIMTAEAGKALDSLEDKTRTTLKRAISMNRTIHWSGKVPLSGKFQRRLEYALPKIRRNDYMRLKSTSSMISQRSVIEIDGKNDYFEPNLSGDKV